ncbi:MAG: ribosomal protein S18-alanine N-acetyltransferase [Bacillaceae bacterium]|nr:ribosomal protein S18-alanine N-acetyltransferase [Bacillaceae bacterium]
MEEENKPKNTGEQGKEPIFRAMTLDDIDAIFEVEQKSFAVPWSRDAFYNELTRNQFAHYLVVEWEGKVVGYGGMWLIIDEAHITNIAIHPEARGRKFGEQLLRRLLEVAEQKGANRVTLEVRRSNQIAQNLYKKLGFYAVGIRPQYYTDNKEDAIIMWVGLKE